MATLISLLRGINVRGHKKIKMDALRALYESLGLKNARSHLQSGNVVFECKSADVVRLARRLESSIEKSFGFHTDVIIRSTAELRDVIARNPFPDVPKRDPSRLVVMFLSATAQKKAMHALLETFSGPEDVHFSGREVFLYYPNGIGRSKLTNSLIGNKLKTRGTARNWNTVAKLLEVADGLGAPPR